MIASSDSLVFQNQDFLWERLQGFVQALAFQREYFAQRKEDATKKAPTEEEFMLHLPKTKPEGKKNDFFESLQDNYGYKKRQKQPNLANISSSRLSMKHKHEDYDEVSLKSPKETKKKEQDPNHPMKSSSNQSRKTFKRPKVTIIQEP